MADNTHIQWTNATWNLVTGCTKNLPGVGGTTGVELHSDRLALPMTWRKPRRIFVNSLADLFHDSVPDRLIADAHAVMALTPQHTYQVLTKRPARMRALLTSASFLELVQRAVQVRVASGPANPGGGPRLVDPLSRWPLPNVWLGVSIENQRWADIRIPILLDTPAAVRWLSCEPLLGPVDLGIDDPHRGHDSDDVHGHPHPSICLTCSTDDCEVEYWRREPGGNGIGWVVVGGESGKDARPMFPDWARSIRDQCTAANVPFFYRQTGEWADLTPGVAPGREIRAYPGGVLLQRIGKQLAGRELDGREWNEYPALAPVT